MITTTHTLTASDGSTVNAISAAAWSLSVAQREKNAKVSRKGDERNPECHFCGRKMSRNAAANAWHVHMTVDSELVEFNADMGANSQGWFPIGSECAKMIPLTHRRKVAN